MLSVLSMVDSVLCLSFSSITARGVVVRVFAKVVQTEDRSFRSINVSPEIDALQTMKETIAWWDDVTLQYIAEDLTLFDGE